MKFVKMHAGGNDYVLVDARFEDADWSSLARAICDRHYGVGADGLLTILPSTSAHIGMRMFNPDGSEAEMCCNGTRCFAKNVLEEGLVDPEGLLTIETRSGVIIVEPFMEGNVVVGAREEVIVPRVQPKEIPIDLPDKRELAIDVSLDIDGHTLYLTSVSIGNPHAVVFLNDSINDFPLSQIGPQVENHKFFPNRVNFEIVNVVAGNRVKARVWERGVGETSSCGTGACAVVVAGQLKGILEQTVEVVLPGGPLQVDWAGPAEKVFLSGPVDQVFTGVWGL